ncbi:benzoate-CoA ligase family protein [Actinomadura barringtoniae]|uniref:Benzoate-CoA ligase family protein n=1 Tax=Actinomadura barringtoniae TaxID=1427535 RepID=A0A939PKC9_9ACTN|nr:benzoate-CoA ligase family protein [Actinomadura barringtoniae]MBO2450769.1 benzoate-CoA ligase family protein [Actinomadura barringtoniae]
MATSTFLGTSFNACSYLLDDRVAGGLGDQPAIAGPLGAFTYAELLGKVRDLAAGLRALDVRPEERIVLFMPDGPALAATILAAMRIGAVPVPVSTMQTGKELSLVLRDSGARVLVAGDPFLLAAEQAAAQSPELRHVVVDGHGDFTASPSAALHRLGDLRGDDSEPYDTREDSSALWLYTSGTTGTPKGAIHRHANIRHVNETFGSQVLGITAQDRCFSIPKLFFAYGIGNSLFFPFSVGATTILDPARPTPASVAQRVQEDRPTLFFAVPTFYAALLAADLPSELFSSVRLAVSAGEPLPPELYRRFTERFGVELIDGIGTTEALHIFLSNRPGKVRPGTTGRPVPGYELRVVDEHGNDVETGTPGSLLVKGDSIATGYWCRTDTTRSVFEGHWLRTGDTYVTDADGYYSCLGRTNDMLKAGGIWVSPTEVEARLLEHPDVLLAAVVGLPDADGLDKPVACVVPNEGSTITADELIEFCRAGLASFKRPREVLIVDKLPTTATGKLQRFAVREFAASLLRAQQ